MSAAVFPLFLKDDAFRPPDEPIYYLLAREGLYLVRRSPLFTTELRVDGLPWLEPHREAARLDLPTRIPVDLLEQALDFFRAVFERHRSEAILLLYYVPAEQRYELAAPRQEVSPLACRYAPGPTPEGRVRAGTIHSHGALAAGHSDVDERDERYDDGLHFTVGSLDSVPSLHCELVASGRRFPVPLSEIVDRQPARPVPPEWLEAVSGPSGG